MGFANGSTHPAGYVDTGFGRQLWRECGVTGRITPTEVMGGFVTAKAAESLIAHRSE
jgi:hypothetical protein